MTDWRFEMAEAALVAVTAGALIFLRENFVASAVIFSIVLIFCALRSMARPALELEIQTHWLILAAAAGVCAYEMRAVAVAFLAAYASARFFVSLLRYGEARELLRESQNLRESHEAELQNLRRDSESRLRNTIGELKLRQLRESFNLRSEYQAKFLRRIQNKNEPPQSSDDSAK